MNRSYDGEAESIPFEPGSLDPEKKPEGMREEIEPEETESGENDDFEIGISIEEMQDGKSVGGSAQPVEAFIEPVRPDQLSRMEEPKGDAAQDVPLESGLSAHVDQPYPLSEQIPEPAVVRSEDRAVYAVERNKPTSPDQPVPESLLAAMTSIDERLVQLADLFETKINVDNHKNKVIDSLHGELQTFREGIIKKQFYSFVTDVIKVIDDVRKFKRHYDEMPPTAGNMDSLLNFLEGIASDIEDLFSWQGVVPFCCDEGILDTGRQRVINKIECDDPALDRMVAESIRPGYEWDGRVIRPEMVSVYIYTNKNGQKNGQEDTLADGKTD